MKEPISYREGDDVVIVLDEDNDDVGVYPNLSRAMDYVADLMAVRTDRNVDEDIEEFKVRRQEIRESMKAIETTYGWVVECLDRSFRALTSALRS